MSSLRAVIVMDYQNVHLTGHELFGKSKGIPPHEVLIDPLHFANQLIRARNLAQRPGMDHASLSRVLVYRGQPSVEHDPKPYSRSQAQKAQWERDTRVTVTLRPLKYKYVYDNDGHALRDANGKRFVTGKQEKGIDVLCALAVVREARSTDIDLVILASQDSDLEPSLDEAYSLASAKIETFCWFDRANPRLARQLRLSTRKPLWNRRLGETEMLNCIDRTNYI